MSLHFDRCWGLGKEKNSKCSSVRLKCSEKSRKVLKGIGKLLPFLLTQIEVGLNLSSSRGIDEFKSV